MFGLVKTFSDVCDRTFSRIVIRPLKWAFRAPFCICAVCLGTIDGVISGIFGNKHARGTCFACRIRSYVSYHVRLKMMQVDHWMTNTQGNLPGANNQGATVPIRVHQPISHQRQLEIDEYLIDNSSSGNEVDFEDDYFDIDPTVPSTIRSLQANAVGAISTLKTTVLYPLKKCRDAITFGGKTFRSLKLIVINISSERFTRMRNLPHRTFTNICKRITGVVESLGVTSSDGGRVAEVVRVNVATWGRVGSELALKASNHLPASGKCVVDGVTDILANTQAIRQEVNDPLRGPLNMRTDCPVILDRIALAAFRAGNWLLGLRGTQEEETLFLENYHGHLQKMQTRARNIDYNVTLDEITAPDHAPSILVNLSAQAPACEVHNAITLRERSSTVL